MLAPPTFFWLWLAALAWVVLVFVASIVYRRCQGMPILRPRLPQTLYLETWRSGYSRYRWFSQYFAARNCLWVAVTDTHLHVALHFPFNLLMPRWTRMEFSVPGAAIKSVEKKNNFLRQSVRLTFERTPGVEEQFEIDLNAPTTFIAAVEAVKQAGQPIGSP